MALRKSALVFGRNRPRRNRARADYALTTTTVMKEKRLYSFEYLRYAPLEDLPEAERAAGELRRRSLLEVVRALFGLSGRRSRVA